MLPKRIRDFLNSGDVVAAEVPVALDRHCFVRIRPIPNPAVPREERRYLNSKWSMWDYWWYDLRRMELQLGWENAGYDYDRFLVVDEKVLTKTEEEFLVALGKWVPSLDQLRHYSESRCPE